MTIENLNRHSSIANDTFVSSNDVQICRTNSKKTKKFRNTHILVVQLNSTTLAALIVNPRLSFPKYFLEVQYEMAVEESSILQDRKRKSACNETSQSH